MRRNAIIIAVVFLAAIAIGRWRSPRLPVVPVPEAPAHKSNIILISIDTLRPDHLGCYGYPVVTSPAIDRFRKDAILFRAAYAAAPATLISHATMLTSMIPQHHGASYQQFRGVAAETVTLAEVLHDTGYATWAVTGGGQLDPAYGLNQGFDAYETRTSFRDAITRAMQLVDGRRASPFFLFLHTYDVHVPYHHTPDALEAVDPGYTGTFPSTVTPKLVDQINGSNRPMQQADQRRLVSMYDAGILTMDRAFGVLVAELRQRGLYDDSLIVFVSDHGEEFGEHGKQAVHSHTLYDELLRIPLIVKLPGAARAGETVDAMTRGLDVAPVILKAAGLPPSPLFEGIDMLQPFDAGEPPDSFAVLRREVSPWERDLWTGVRTTEWKLYGPRLYDLKRDPGETTDVASKHKNVARAMAEVRDATISARPSAAGVAVRPSEELKARLRALGYTGG